MGSFKKTEPCTIWVELLTSYRKCRLHGASDLRPIFLQVGNKLRSFNTKMDQVKSSTTRLGEWVMIHIYSRFHIGNLYFGYSITKWLTIWVTPFEFFEAQTCFHFNSAIHAKQFSFELSRRIGWYTQKGLVLLKCVFFFSYFSKGWALGQVARSNMRIATPAPSERGRGENEPHEDSSKVPWCWK